MDEATQNAIAEAAQRLDHAREIREGTAMPVGHMFHDNKEFHAALIGEAQGWASLAVAAAISGSAPQMPSIADIMSQMTGGAGT